MVCFVRAHRAFSAGIGAKSIASQGEVYDLSLVATSDEDLAEYTTFSTAWAIPAIILGLTPAHASTERSWSLLGNRPMQRLSPATWIDILYPSTAFEALPSPPCHDAKFRIPRERERGKNRAPLRLTSGWPADKPRLRGRGSTLPWSDFTKRQDLGNRNAWIAMGQRPPNYLPVLTYDGGEL